MTMKRPKEELFVGGKTTELGKAAARRALGGVMTKPDYAKLVQELEALHGATAREPLCYFREKCKEAAAAITALDKENASLSWYIKRLHDDMSLELASEEELYQRLHG
jgi:hypothetical protein